MGITLGLLAATSILELFVMRPFRAVIYVVETFLQRSFWPVERLLFAILVCLIDGVLGMACERNFRAGNRRADQ
jgi:hypothetical protein